MATYQNTLVKALRTFMLGRKAIPSKEVQKNISSAFNFNFNLDEINKKLQTLRNLLTELNVTVSDAHQLSGLNEFNEGFDINLKETSHSNLYEYGQEYISRLKNIYVDVEKNYVSSYDVFIESFFSTTNNLGYHRYIDIPFTRFTRTDLINQLQSFNLKKELLDSFKKINYEKYSDVTLYLFYISTSSSNPPTSSSEVQSKLEKIESFCKDNMPSMEGLNFEMDASMVDTTNNLNNKCDQGIETLSEIQTATSNDDNDIHIRPGPDSPKSLIVPRSLN